METGFDSTDRTPAEYVLFAFGFLGFLLIAGGIVVSSPFVAVAGLAVLFLSVFGSALAAPA
ncbi:MAG TPA: hypothetical protein VHI52_21530 [Verrucomicrobiae bacterium]|nr:hypothetical protein [Verrucomicrobiae bacterium]